MPTLAENAPRAGEFTTFWGSAFQSYTFYKEKGIEGSSWEVGLQKESGGEGLTCARDRVRDFIVLFK